MVFCFLKQRFEPLKVAAGQSVHNLLPCPALFSRTDVPEDVVTVFVFRIHRQLCDQRLVIQSFKPRLLKARLPGQPTLNFQLCENLARFRHFAQLFQPHGLQTLENVEIRCHAAARAH